MRRSWLAKAQIAKQVAKWSVILLVILSGAAALHAACGAEFSAKQADGMVVDHYLSDGILHRRWAIVMDCNHPERPWKMELRKTETEEVAWRDQPAARVHRAAVALPPPVRSSPLVSPGMQVRVWRSEADSRMEMTGTALKAGAAGQHIRVRVLNAMGQPEVVLEGVVRGAGSVEMLAPVRWNSQ